VQPLLLWKSNEHHTTWVCVCSLSYPARNAHVPDCQLWPAPLYNIFPRYFINSMIFDKKSYGTRNVCFAFLYNFYLKHFSFYKKKISEIRCEMYSGLHVKYTLFLSDFNETWTFSTDFRKVFKYQISWKSVQWESSCSMRTDRHDEANSRFLHFCERA